MSERSPITDVIEHWLEYVTGARKILGKRLTDPDFKKPTPAQIVAGNPEELAQKFPEWDAVLRALVLLDDTQNEMIAAIEETGKPVVGKRSAKVNGG